MVITRKHKKRLPVLMGIVTSKSVCWRTQILRCPMHQPMFRAASFRSLLVFVILLGFQSSYGADSGATSSISGSGSSSGGGTGGVGIFSGPPFQVDFSLRAGYDDNVSTTRTNEQGSAFTTGGVTLTYKFGDDRTRISLQAGGGLTYYFEKVSTNTVDPNAFLNLALTHKATARLTLSVTAYASFQQDPDFTLRLQLNRRGGNFFYTDDKFTATYQWLPRFATATSYTLGVVHYDSSSNSFLNRFENTFGNEFRFLLWPTTTIVAEYRFELVNYDQLNRDSTTHYALAGFDHVFNPRLNIALRGGAEFRQFQNSGNKSSPYFEGTANYALGKNTTVSWTNRYAIQEPDILFNPNRTSFQTGLQARHNFTARISGTLAAYYEHDDYDSLSMPVFTPGFIEQSLDVACTVRYSVTRYFALEVGCDHTEIISDVSAREYSRNKVYGGLNLTF